MKIELTGRTYAVDDVRLLAPVIPRSKVIGIGPPFELGDDMHADIARIQRWYKPYRGRNHDVVQPAGG